MPPPTKHILAYFERSFMHLYALSSSNSISSHIGGKAEVWEELPPAST